MDPEGVNYVAKTTSVLGSVMANRRGAKLTYFGKQNEFLAYFPQEQKKGNISGFYGLDQRTVGGKRARFGLILSFDRNVISLDKTEGIFCKKIPVHSIRPDPASSSAETPIVTISTPAPEPGLFFPEP
jgi:hypothetical protein